MKDYKQRLLRAVKACNRTCAWLVILEREVLELPEFTWQIDTVLFHSTIEHIELILDQIRYVKKTRVVEGVAKMATLTLRSLVGVFIAEE